MNALEPGLPSMSALEAGSCTRLRWPKLPRELLLLVAVLDGPSLLPVLAILAWWFPLPAVVAVALLLAARTNPGDPDVRA